jgi:cystathionine gamma-synthase
LNLRPATRAVVVGRGEGRAGEPVNVAVPLASTYRSGGDIAYGREDNSVWQALEEVIGDLEGGTALCFSSGMAAISAVLEAVRQGGLVVAPLDAYSGTRSFLDDAVARGRLGCRLVDIADTDATLRCCEGASLLWIESPTNPLMTIADLKGLCEGAHRAGVPAVVDNTFATPLLQRPLELGADVVVHSVTKFLSGHSDIVMGAVVSRDEGWIESLRTRRTLHGAIAGPLEAFLALRGTRTLEVRLSRAQASAAELARRLDAHPAVGSVRYPGLESDPGHELAASQMDGFGAMLSFELVEGREAADRLCEAVKVCVHGTSLGGVETLIERRQRWPADSYLPAGLVRLSVGIEDVEDLWEDLRGGLEAR